MANYEVVIGLEVHVELATKSKIFCSCATEFAKEANSQCCPVCLGLPGSLPVINQQVVEYGVKTGLAFDCEIASLSKFDRKNYFYPDLPKAYQISQYDFPLCRNGKLEFDIEGQRYSCQINRIHIEEDPGKSVHSGDNILDSAYSLVDYNRSGIPLIEIVTEPDLRSAAQAKAFLEQLKQVLQYIGVSDCKMEEGSLRCDANVSLRLIDSPKFGTRVEIKNLNSFKSVERAINFEIQRQTELLDSHEKIIQETRTWSEDQGITFLMRTKEETHDYRYFPEPDLVPLKLNRNWVHMLNSTLPELPLARKDRLIAQYNLSEYDADLLTSSWELTNFFEGAAVFYVNYKKISNWLIGEFTRELNLSELSVANSKITPVKLVDLLKMIDNGLISNKIAKEVFSEMFATGKDSEAIVAERGLQQISNEKEIALIIDGILATNSDNVAEYRAGKEKLLGFFVGQVMKQTKGKANPKLVNQLLKDKLTPDS